MDIFEFFSLGVFQTQLDVLPRVSLESAFDPGAEVHDQERLPLLLCGSSSEQLGALSFREQLGDRSDRVMNRACIPAANCLFLGKQVAARGGKSHVVPYDILREDEARIKLKRLYPQVQMS